MSATLSLENCVWDENFLRPLIGDQTKSTYTIKGHTYHEVKTRVRKHKKKRIDKKWEKIYGYTIEKVPMEIEFKNCVFNVETGTFRVLAER